MRYWFLTLAIGLVASTAAMAQEVAVLGNGVHLQVEGRQMTLPAADFGRFYELYEQARAQMHETPSAETHWLGSVNGVGVGWASEANWPPQNAWATRMPTDPTLLVPYGGQEGPLDPRILTMHSPATIPCLVMQVGGDTIRIPQDEALTLDGQMMSVAWQLEQEPALFRP